MSDPIAALRAVSGNDLSSGATGLPNIPQVPASADPAMTNILASMKAWMEKAMGNGVTGFASKQELINAGVPKTDAAGNVVGQFDAERAAGANRTAGQRRYDQHSGAVGYASRQD